jgi:glycosyltransferase involved in cell wall biosynthesis
LREHGLSRTAPQLRHTRTQDDFIIIPTFNEEKVIESTLCTLASTLTLPHEVIVSDGGSSDRTVELAAKYAAGRRDLFGPAVRRLRKSETTAPRPPVATSSSSSMPIVSSRNLIGSLPKRCRNFGSILTWSRSPPICACSRRRETFGDKLAHGVANLGLRLKNNLFNRGESFGEF